MSGSRAEGRLRFLVESSDFKDSSDHSRPHTEWVPLVHPDLNTEHPAVAVRPLQLPLQPPTAPYDFKAGDTLEVCPTGPCT